MIVILLSFGHAPRTGGADADEAIFTAMLNKQLAI